MPLTPFLPTASLRGMWRRHLILVLLAVLLAPFSAAAGEPIVAKYESGSLENYLAGRLLVARQEDAEFLERVAEAVRAGDLPESVVRGTCEWAVLRAMKRNTRYPFPYFRVAIPIKARHFGVEL